MKTMTLIVMALSLGGCAKGMISVDALRPTIDPVLARHDSYVAADSNLSQTERETFLRSAELIRKVLDEAAKGTP